MKTKHILYLYFSLFMGYLTTEFLNYNYYVVYILSTILYWFVCYYTDKILNHFNINIISTEKRTHIQKREVGGDVVRTIAILLVPTVHFFGAANYYETEFTREMIFPTAIRWISICCVPLFMIISGYFKINSKICKKHYFAIIPLLFTHLFINGIHIYVDYMFFDKYVDLDYIIDRLVYFQYGWYVLLYIGMLFIMPFFNILYKNINIKTHKEILILTIMGLTALGPLTNNVISAYWVPIYVFGYYAIGAYLSEYKVKINPIIGLGVFIALLSVISVSTYIHCKGTVFDWEFIGYGNTSAYSSMAAFFLASIIMCFGINIDFKFKPVRKILMWISTVSLEMYLFSQIFDQFIYRYVYEQNYPFLDSFNIIVYTVGFNFVLSFVASRIKKFLFDMFKPAYK